MLNYNIESEKGSGLSIMSPDILLFALPLALLIDILDWVLEIGTIVSLIMGAPLVIWMVWRSGSTEKAGEQIQRVRGGQKGVARQALKRASKRALRRGVLIFIIELIPILNLFPFWVIAVVKTLREK